MSGVDQMSMWSRMLLLGNPRPSTILKRVLVLVVVLIVAACSSIPQKELDGYVGAVKVARAAGEQLTYDWRAAKAELERREAAKKPPSVPAPAPPIPLTWTPPSSDVARITPEEVRLLAWEAISEYTATLAALNAGESVEAVKGTTGRLFALVQKVAGTAIPGGEPLLALLQELAGQLEKARLAAEFKRAVTGGAPTVHKMLVIFYQDAVNHAELRASLASSDYQRVKFESDLTEEEKRAKQLRIKAENEAFRQSLDDFAHLLEQLGQSLKALTTAVDRPIDFVAQSNRILDIASSLKAHWGAYRDARSEARF